MRKKWKGHYCRICDTFKANEAFSGKGHHKHICRDCQRLPREEREYIEIMDELWGYLKQSNISAGNVKRLGALATHSHPKIRTRAIALLELAAVKPHKRRRWKYLGRQRPDLLVRLKTLFSEIEYDSTLDLHEPFDMPIDDMPMDSPDWQIAPLEFLTVATDEDELHPDDQRKSLRQEDTEDDEIPF